MMQTRVMDWETLELLKQDPFVEIPSTCRHRMASHHRVDLHSGIRHLEAQNSSVSIKLGAAVAKIDFNVRTLGLEDGS